MSTSQENNILPSSPLPYENLSPMASATSSRNNNIQQPIAPSLAFFYNPPSFLISYHITCEEIPVSFELVYQLTNDADDRAYNYVLPDSYVFYHSQFNTKKIYRQFLTNYLAHGNMVHDNFSDETMDGPPSFRNTTNGDYTQDYENNPSLFNPNIDNIQQDV
ncbi:3952_t:CDS:2 [Rhizophagus irregularis]|nr:3952_t:CDS:2 [Rhizophagus irregularis]